MRCHCPDDCNCRHPHRMNFCGCRCLETPERAPQGEAMPLFTPAPAQMPGQTAFSLAATRDGRPMNSDEQRADRWARIAASRENPGT